MSDIKGELLKIRQHTNSTKYELARLQVEATLELTEQIKRIADVFAGVSSTVNDVETGEAWKVLAIVDVSRGKTAVKNPD